MLILHKSKWFFMIFSKNARKQMVFTLLWWFSMFFQRLCGQSSEEGAILIRTDERIDPQSAFWKLRTTTARKKFFNPRAREHSFCYVKAMRKPSYCYEKIQPTVGWKLRGRSDANTNWWTHRPSKSILEALADHCAKEVCQSEAVGSRTLLLLCESYEKTIM